MARVDVPYVQRFTDRHGKTRLYFRKPGYPRKPLPSPADPTFSARYHEALGQTKRPVGLSQTRPGTIGALLMLYYGSADFAALKPITQANYRNILERFRAEYGHNPVTELSREAIIAMLDEKRATPGAARNFFKRLRKLLDFAVDRGWLSTNPAMTIKRKAPKTEGFIPWSEEDIEQFLETWGTGTRARLSLLLILYTGQRRSDVTRMGRQHVRGEKIHVVQDKGGARLWIPLHATLKAELDALPMDNLTFIMTAYGKPMSYAGFTQWFVECAEKAGLTNRSPHGLRKAAGRRLAEAGCSTKEIMAVLGHKTMAEAARYTEAADQQRLADAAITRLSEAGS